MNTVLKVNTQAENQPEVPGSALCKHITDGLTRSDGGISFFVVGSEQPHQAPLYICVKKKQNLLCLL